MKFLRSLSIISSLFLCAGLAAQVTHLGNPLWEFPIFDNAVFLEPVDMTTEPGEEAVSENNLPGLSPLIETAALTVPEAVDAEIVELARGLNNDPLEIFNWVRNNIGYEHYYGIRRGARLTLLEGRGNDMDQCLLLAEMLKAANISSSSIQYRRARHRMALTHPSGISVYGLLGLDEDPYPGQTFEEAFGIPVPGSFSHLTEQQAKLIQFAFNRLNQLGTPELAPWTGFTTMVFPRVWLQLTINGAAYDLDPSFKTYEKIEGLDLLADTSYSRSALLGAAGGSTGTGYAQNLNSANISNYLDGINADILSQIRTQYPTLSLAEIISGKRIIRNDAASLNDCFPMNEVYNNQRVNLITITSSLGNYESMVRFQAGSMNYEVPTADLSGRKITLTFDDDKVELRLDDGEFPVDETSTTANSIDLTITVTHPGGVFSPQSETKTYRKNNGFMYAILYGFSPSGRLLQERYKILNEYLDEGKPEDSREVRTEILNIMGLTWLYQTQLNAKFLANEAGLDTIFTHSFGRMAQEEGFYVDVGLVFARILPLDGVEDEAFDNARHLTALYASALEHGIIEQMQAGASAVSTVNIIREANDAGQRIYLANSSNWNSGVKNQIDDNYSSAQVTEFTSLITNDDAKLLLPYNDNVNQGIWTGTGYIIRSNNEAGMIISGGYNGGYSTNFGFVGSTSLTTSYNTNPITNYTPPSLAPLLTPYSHSAPSLFSFDPVEMSTGAFYLESTDLQTGIAQAPRGLSFSRTYRSNTVAADNQNLGYGWTHNLHIRAVERTAIEEGLGSGTPEQAAALLTSMLIASDLYRDDGSAKEWVTAALTVGWFTDKLLNNAVSITMGKDIFQFIEQPDGSYTAPAGQTMTLRKVNGQYELEQRLGNTIYFNSEGRAQRIEDIDGKAMTFVYHSDSRLNYVQDAYGRRLTFGYNADDRITGVTCSTGRSVSYRYDAEGNLDRYTGPEGKYRYYIYEAASDPDGALPADPSATAASEHRMVRLRNHDKEIITQNVYDPLGRVFEQYMHGDISQTWKLRYTGYCNTEENPEGGIKCFFYDERGRSIAIEDESGNRASWVYDGQDQIVERTSAEGEVTTFTFDGDHNVTRIDYPRGGGSTINQYDSLHRLTQTTDPEGNVTQLIYATSGFDQGKNRPRQVIDPEGTTTLTYHESGEAAGQLHTITDADGLVTEHNYDTYGQPYYTIAPGNFYTVFIYNSRGDLTDLYSPRFTHTTWQYNNRRQVTQAIYDNGGGDQAVETFTYNNQGLPATTQAPVDNNSQRVETRLEYTPTDKVDLERLVNETATLADDIVADYTYDGRDWNTAIDDASGRRTSLSYFDNGELQQVTRPASTATRNSSFTYDADNRPLTQSDPGAPMVRNSSFAYGVTDTAAGDFTSGYPKTTFTDPSSRTTVSEFDRLGRLRYYSNKKGFIFEFNYDGLGRPTEVVTPNGHTTTTAYNHRGAPTQITEPSGETTTFAYDPTTGRLSSQTDDVGTISFTAYDDDGNLLTLQEGGATITRTYDNLGRVSSYTDSAGNTLGYRYYPSGKLKKLIYPGGTENGVGHVEYTYWKTGRLKNVIDKLVSTTSPRTSTYTWNNDGRLARIDRPNGTRRVITYDASGRPASIEERTPFNFLIVRYDLTYFDSDEVHTLTTAPSLNIEDLASPASLNLTYDADNRLATYQRPYVLGGNIETVVHDDDGNMTQGPGVSGAPATYTYDARNRLTEVDGLTYSYDAEDIRTQVSGSGGTTTYVTDPHGALSRVLSRTKGGVTTRYVYGVGLLYEVDAAGKAIYYHFDHVGNTAALTNQVTGVIERFRYSPYGVVTYQENSFDTPFKFGGFFGIQTDANGLVHMRARYYNPLIRRFINSDPARDAWNWFAYAGGNPVSFVDPTGLETASFTSSGSFGSFSGSSIGSLGFANTPETQATIGFVLAMPRDSGIRDIDIDQSQLAVENFAQKHNANAQFIDFYKKDELINDLKNVQINNPSMSRLIVNIHGHTLLDNGGNRIAGIAIGTNGEGRSGYLDETLIKEIKNSTGGLVNCLHCTLEQDIPFWGPNGNGPNNPSMTTRMQLRWIEQLNKFNSEN